MYGCSDWRGCRCDRPAVIHGAVTFPPGNAASRCSSENDHAKHETNAGQRMDQSTSKKRKDRCQRDELVGANDQLRPFQRWHAGDGYFHTAHAYMLISRSTGTWTIFGVFQIIMKSPRASTMRHDCRASVNGRAADRLRFPTCVTHAANRSERRFLHADLSNCRSKLKP
jgi:hypothetical protein